MAYCTAKRNSEIIKLELFKTDTQLFEISNYFEDF